VRDGGSFASCFGKLGSQSFEEKVVRFWVVDLVACPLVEHAVLAARFDVGWLAGAHLLYLSACINPEEGHSASKTGVEIERVLGDIGLPRVSLSTWEPNRQFLELGIPRTWDQQ
jgi:hypothetical protein